MKPRFSFDCLGKVLPVLFILYTSSFCQYVFNSSDIKGPVCVLRDSIQKTTILLSPDQSQYNVVITDGYARCMLTQKFVNRQHTMTSLVYVFPMPDNASISAMSMEYRDKIYRAKIVELTLAQHLYDSVRVAGGQAALLIQNRPNIFQQYIANIAMGDSAYVRIEMCMPLKYNAGEYELSLPTMIGERFQSDGVTPVPSSGTLWNPPENRSGQGLQINVLLQAGFPIKDISSPTHALDIGTVETAMPMLEARDVVRKSTPCVMPYNRSIMLPAVDTYPNRDYVLRFKRATKSRDMTFASHLNADYGKGHFALNVFPDDSLFGNTRQNLEIILLIDVSGSQSGWPLQKEQSIALDILSRLKPTDRLSVLSFSDYVSWAFDNSTPVYATEPNLTKAKNFINGLVPLGGTQLLSGVQAALKSPLTTENSRFFVFLTDGFITNETAIVDVIKNDDSKPTIFTFGAGNNLNRSFLEQCAAVGNGYATEVTQNEDPHPLVNNAWEKIESPQMSNVSVRFDGVNVSDCIMPQGTNLYKGSPLSLYGTYLVGGAATATITGFRLGQPVTMTRQVLFAEGLTTNTMMPQIWAKKKIEQLSIAEGTTTAKRDSIITISVGYQVLSKYTAFLAISSESIVPGESIREQMNQSYATPVADGPVALADATITLSCRKGFLSLTLGCGLDVSDICVYDMLGKLVFRARINAHLRLFTWDGRLSNGHVLKNGNYLVSITLMHGKTITRRLAWYGQ